MRLANRDKCLLLPTQGANPRRLSDNLRRGDPLFGERSEGFEQLGKVRQLGDAGDIAVADRHDPLTLREASGDVCSCQLLRCEQKPAIGSQPERVVESTAPVEGVWRQRTRLEPELDCGIRLRGLLLSESLVLLELSLPPLPHLASGHRGSSQHAKADDEREVLHGRVLSRERSP